MSLSPSQRKAQAAWDRIEALGGHGVWERELVIVSLADTAITDDDLALFRDFPFVQTLDLSHTTIGDSGLLHLAGLPASAKVTARDLARTGARVVIVGLSQQRCEMAAESIRQEPGNPPLTYSRRQGRMHT
jgi:hypothetical protein